MKFVALVLFLTACSQPYNVECSGKLSDPLVDSTARVMASDTANIVLDPWPGHNPPYAVFFDDTADTAAEGMDQGITRLNELAGAELVYQTDDATLADFAVNVAHMDGLAGNAHCDGVTCGITIDPDYVSSSEVALHELCHMMGYTAPDGDVHDHIGVMEGSGSLNATVYPRLALYLKMLADTKR